MLFEGARLIAGDGRPAVENSAFLVEGSRITQVGTRGAIAAASWRHGRRSSGQDGHACSRRRPQPSRLHRRADGRHVLDSLHAREPARSSSSLRLLRNRRHAEHGPRPRRTAVRTAGQASRRRRALSHGRPRHRHAERRDRTRCTGGTRPTASRPRPRRGRRSASSPRRKSTSSRSGSTTGTRPSRRSRRRSIDRSSRRRTRAAFASSRTSTTWRTRRSCCAPASTDSRTASATSKWTTRSWGCSKRGPRCSSSRTCRTRRRRPPIWCG